ncbi:hypothetical protein D3H34_18285 [Acidovorax cavernicola]|uniref:Uncharacterized protein n=1 Tax=Acidovorax cavernicola TaxID=1675792 RepID=A0A9X8GUB7_9BURK|nr:hypothetical protein D3H34_18285 [Acidovorax cavernicola]
MILVSSPRHIPFFLKIHDEFLARQISCQFSVQLAELTRTPPKDDVVYLVDSTDANDDRLLDLVVTLRDLRAQAALLFIEAQRVQEPIAVYSQRIFMLSADASPETVVDFVFNHRAMRTARPLQVDDDIDAAGADFVTDPGVSFMAA